MIFTKESIGKIIDGSKVQTRRIMKEGAVWQVKNTDEQTTKVLTLLGKTKWQVDKVYAVQSKRGGDVVQYCKVCQRIYHNRKERLTGFIPCQGLTPLCIKITAIRKEKLSNITESDAKAEGAPFKDFPSNDLVASFLWEFHKINKLKCTKIGAFQNPDVWVITFEVIK